MGFTTVLDKHSVFSVDHKGRGGSPDSIFFGIFSKDEECNVIVMGIAANPVSDRYTYLHATTL